MEELSIVIKRDEEENNTVGYRLHTNYSLNSSIVVSINLHTNLHQMIQIQNPSPHLTMLLKFFRCRNHNNNIPPNPNPNVAGEEPLILQIIHAGGRIERYYMPFPARWIMDKYPNFVLARPEIFRRPWDSVVRLEEMLVPGQKYFVVPIPSVKKLHRRLRKPVVEMPSCSMAPVGKPKTVSNGNGGRLKRSTLRFSPSLTVIHETDGLDD